MEKEKLWLLMVLNSLTIFLALINYSNSIESPDYRLILQLESDTEIRLFKESLWLSAVVENVTTFQKSTKDGFHRIYQYIHGANLNNAQITITAPVLTTIFPGTPASDCYVKFYLPAKYEAAPPLPKPELNLRFERWKAQCLAVRKFSGFALEESVSKEINVLVATLNKIFTGKAQISEDNAAFSIAQYNASSHLSGRVNEVWLNVPGLEIEGCSSV